MRDISISIDVFAAIWAQRISGEQTENDIMERVLMEYQTLKEVAGRVSADSLIGKATSVKLPEPSLGDGTEGVDVQDEEITSKHDTLSGSLSNHPIGKIRWVDDVQASLEQLGGTASLHQIYKSVESRRRDGGRSVPKTLDATIRRTLEDHSSDSANFRGADLFAKVGRGRWAIR